MSNKIKLAAIFVSVMLLASFTFAVTEVVITQAWWTVPSSVSFIVWLYGESGTASSVVGTATTDINFSSAADGNSKYVNATVVGGSTQDETNPIYKIYNDGNVNLNMTMIVNNTLPTGVVLWGGITFDGITSPSSVNDSTHWIFNGTFFPGSTADWNQSIWLWSNFTSVVQGEYVRDINVSGNN